MEIKKQKKFKGEAQIEKNRKRDIQKTVSQQAITKTIKKKITLQRTPTLT